MLAQITGLQALRGGRRGDAGGGAEKNNTSKRSTVKFSKTSSCKNSAVVINLVKYGGDAIWCGDKLSRTSFQQQMLVASIGHRFAAVMNPEAPDCFFLSPHLAR